MTLDLKPEIAAVLEARASAQGLSVEAYLERLLTNEGPIEPEPNGAEDTGMVAENGLFVYRTGKPLAKMVIDEAIRRSREERAQHLVRDPF
jgi:hypothetical protein